MVKYKSSLSFFRGNGIRFYLIISVLVFSHLAFTQPNPNTLALASDWLIHPISQKATVSLQDNILVIENGLLRRKFALSPNVGCFDYTNLSNGQQLIRAIKPEAKVTIDGVSYSVGGLYGQKEMAYFLPEWLPSLYAHPHDFIFDKYSIQDVKPLLQWHRTTWTPPIIPVSGKEIIFHYHNASDQLKDVLIQVHYTLYDGVPLIGKWITIENQSTHTIKIDRVVHEILGLVEEESAVVGSPQEMKKQHGIYIESNYAFNNAMRYDISDQTTHWLTDSSYTSQVNYNYQTPCLLEIYPEKVLGIDVLSGDSFHSVHTYELLMDSYDRQRRGMMIKRMYKTIAPWTQQNPIFMHLVSKSDEQVIHAIDQCDSTGYEAVILSFGSHLNMEDTTISNLQRWKSLADYAHKKGILLGGYSLFSSRRISDADDVIDPKTGMPGGALFGHAPCFGSLWGLAYRDKIKKFFTFTGFDIWENDGPYPGDLCASKIHPGHRDVEDSQWRQMEIQKNLYHWLNEKGVYINAPDWYFLDGTHKIALGYREVNFSLPRDQQRILNRQNIYDGTQEKSGSMSWGFVPLTKYQGGDESAILEPLSEHLKDYEQLMMQYYGAGVQACYRGPRLYDTDATRLVVSNTIKWYKKYRAILNSDIIHLRRADGVDWDGFLHVNPTLKEKGFLMVFNPTKEKISRTIHLPLYYTGLYSSAMVTDQKGKKIRYTLNRNYEINLKITIPPYGNAWYLIE